MALKFSMILEAIDRASAPAKRARASISGLASGVRRWGQDVRRVSSDITSGARSLEHYERRARRLRQVALGTFFRAAGQQARRFANDVRTGVRNLDLLGRAGRGAKAGLGWIGGKALGAAKWGALAAGAASAATGGWFLSGIISTGATFEQLQAQLEGTEGSADNARKALEWVLKFAKDTPYAIEGVADALVRARNLGIDPFNGAMMSMGDAAAANRKTLVDAVEAIGDAQTKEYERLKEFGITSSTKGAMVTFSYVAKDGKNAFKTVKADAENIRKTVLQIWDAKYAGGMIRQSKTLVGLWENIKDSVTFFQYKIANAGWFNNIKEKAAQVLDTLNRWSDDGTLDKWAKYISDNLGDATDKAWAFVKETDWQQVGRDLKTIADAAMGVARAIVWATEKLQALARVNVPPEIWLGLKAAGWVGGWGSGKPTKGGGAVGPVSQEPSGNSGRGRPRPPAAPPSVPPAGTGRWRRLPAGERKVGFAAPPTKVGGVLDVNVKVQGPATASVGRVTTVNRAVPINAKVGKVMGGPA